MVCAETIRTWCCTGALKSVNKIDDHSFSAFEELIGYLDLSTLARLASPHNEALVQGAEKRHDSMPTLSKANKGKRPS